jgi:cell division protease FtsH
MGRTKSYSEATAREIDSEVKGIIDHCYQVAREVILTHREKLEAIANALLEYETLDGQQVDEIVRTGKMTPPLVPLDMEPPRGAQAVTTLPELPPKSVPPTLPGLGAAAPAPV